MENTSAIILVGGDSSRMGRPKEQLPWNGKLLLEHQIDKMRQLGISDIILSGTSEQFPDVTTVEDIYKSKGPLGGIHAG